MSVLVANCPECKTKHITMRLTGYSVPSHASNREGLRPFGYVVGICSHCEKPSVYTVDTLGSATWEGTIHYLVSALGQANTNDVSSSGYKVDAFKSSVTASVAPDHLPDDVLKAFQQAETNFDLHGHEEAAATMYRRALERALKSAEPDLGGTLAAKIKKLVGDGKLPRALGDWATEIRIIGNDGAHDDEVSRDDLKAARLFCDSFLRYLITLPREIDLRRSEQPGI